MYKLILVDDEEEVRKGILEKIDWSLYGFEIAGEAENGIEALEIAERVAPDVVITDIKMPFMDGLNLAQKIMDKFSAAKIIILTGFDEFEYAQRAIKIDVVEYLLKPISSKELSDILSKLKEKLDGEIFRKKDIEMLRECYKRSLPLLREKFLGSLISGTVDRKEILQISYTYGINLSGTGFVTAVLNTENKTINSEDEIQDGEETADLLRLHKRENMELTNVAILNICEEIFCKYSCGYTFLHNGRIVTLFTSGSAAMEAFKDNTRTILDEILQSIKRYLKLDAVIGVGTFCRDITGINFSYESALAALDYRIILGNERVILIEDMEPQCIRRVVFDEIRERTLTGSIKVGTAEETTKTIEELFKEIVDAKASFKDYQIYLLEIITTILKAARDLSVDMDGLFGDNYNLFNDMYKFRDLDEVKKWLNGICIRIKGYILKDRQDNCKALVKKAVEYMDNFYHDSDMTIDKVCSYLHISPAYFSTIFKKETKLTFLNYLTHLRMEAAKEMLRTTNYKTFEIAKAVGYSEPNYFSYCFKKNFNISPSEFRKAVINS